MPKHADAPADSTRDLTVDSELVRTLAALLAETGLSEIEYAVGERRIRGARSLAPAAPPALTPPPPPPPPQPPPPSPPSPPMPAPSRGRWWAPSTSRHSPRRHPSPSSATWSPPASRC